MEAFHQVTFSGTELLGCPTDRSITVNVVPDADIGRLFYEYGVSPGVYTARTDTTPAAANDPHETVIAGLLSDTKYYYRMNLRCMNKLYKMLSKITLIFVSTWGIPMPWIHPHWEQG